MGRSGGSRGDHHSFREIDTIESLIASGRIEEVERDLEAAAVEIEMANKHLSSAALLIKHDDPVLAYTGLYDAVRKAISAHMRVHGLRPTMKFGKHVNTFRYARVALRELGIDAHLDRLDQMRDTRHMSEYEARIIGAVQVKGDLVHAQRIVDAVEKVLGG